MLPASGVFNLSFSKQAGKEVLNNTPTKNGNQKGQKEA
jgi:hypothetical protein